MSNRFEQRAESAADFLAGRIRGNQLRVVLFKIQELAHERVVFSVADRGLVEHVIAVGIVVELLGDRCVALPLGVARARSFLGGAHSSPSKMSFPASWQARIARSAPAGLRPASPHVGLTATS